MPQTLCPVYVFFLFSACLRFYNAAQFHGVLNNWRHVLITRWRQTFSLPSSDQLIQLGKLLFSGELWWHRKHVKVKINIMVCGQFDMDFSPYFDSQGMAASRAAHLPHILRASRQMTAAARHNAACRRVFCALCMPAT